jgi:alkylated DNA repair dioxygenase AlkB
MSSLPLLKTPVKTESSFLNIYSFPDKTLLDNCIQEAKDNLDIGLNRNVGFFTDAMKESYYYGRLKVCDSRALTPSLKVLLDMINTMFETDYNGVLINYYENGTNYIDRHSDSMNHTKTGVLIISYGTTRILRVSYKNREGQFKDIPMHHGEVLHMSEHFQTEFEHEIRKDKSIKDARYSLSFHKYTKLGKYK